MASNQCSNCGEVGHFHRTCPNPKNPSLEHWHAAKKIFRAENPEEKRKSEEKWRIRKEWQKEGKTIYFPTLNEGVKALIDGLMNLKDNLDVLGRPDEVEDCDKQLNNLLPRISEVANVGKGFLDSKNHLTLAGDEGNIFVMRLLQLSELRDFMVICVKPVVNGVFKKLSKLQKQNNSKEILKYIYTNHPPKCTFTVDLDAIQRSTVSEIRKLLKKALLQYHPDKQVGEDAQWRVITEAITRCLTAML